MMVNKKGESVSGLPKLFKVIGLLFITSVGLSQKAIITETKNTNPVSKEKYVFPIITIPGRPASTSKINAILQDELLEIDSTGFKRSIFENVWRDPDARSGHWVFTDFSYEILSNANSYTSLSISFTGGKHDQNQTLYFLFDNSGGNKVAFKELLTPAGRDGY